MFSFFSPFFSSGSDEFIFTIEYWYWNGNGNEFSLVASHFNWPYFVEKTLKLEKERKKNFFFLLVQRISCQENSNFRNKFSRPFDFTTLLLFYTISNHNHNQLVIFGTLGVLVELKCFFFMKISNKIINFTLKGFLFRCVCKGQRMSM